MGLRILLAAGLSVLTLLLWPAAAAADSRAERETATANPTADGAEVTASKLGSSDAPSRSSGGTVRCTYIDVGDDLDPFGYGGLDGQLTGFTPTETLVEDRWYFVTCNVNGEQMPGRYFQHTPGELPIDAGLLAAEAYDSLTIAYPTPHTSPPADLRQMVGLRTWLWLDTDGWQPVSATATIPGLAVTATATPTRIVWTMGDGSDPVVCEGPGEAYRPDVPDDEQATDCSHVFQDAGSFTASATVTWDLSWSATNGDGGDLPTVQRTTTLDLEVIERQAVIVDNP